MAHFSIREPIWSERAIGIADHRIGRVNTIECTYMDKEGNLLYPNVALLTESEAKTFPTRKLKNITLRIIPLSIFDKTY